MVWTLMFYDNIGKWYKNTDRSLQKYARIQIEAEIVATSHEHGDHNYIQAVKGSFVHINKTGSFLEHGIEIKGVETFHDKVSGAKKGKNIVYNFTIDGIKLCHCGDLGHTLSDDLVKEIGEVDILLVPVGGGFTIDADDAVKVMNQLDPTVVIPMHYRTKALGPMGLAFAKVDKFIEASALEVKEYKELELNSTNIREYSGIALMKYN
jgi:L-ascorbate metabolism protein UlaG (beta-lactamase superfamily)